jgi:hypothetical protein
VSLSRLALRLAAVEVLRPYAVAGAGPWPTAAGDEVYDSSIEPISDADGWRDFLAKVEGKPVLTVYSEEQETDPTEGEYPADKELLSLVVEIFIAAGNMVEVANPDGSTQQVGNLGAAITSPQIEATLDLIEHQVRGLLDPFNPDPPNTAAAAARQVYTKLARELHHVKSAPIRDATDRLSRQAARTLTFKLRIPHPAAYGASAAGVDPTIAVLPYPLLQVAQMLNPASAGGQLVRQIAAGMAAAASLPPLSDIRIASNLDRGVTPTAANADITSDVSF